MTTPSDAAMAVRDAHAIYRKALGTEHEAAAYQALEEIVREVTRKARTYRRPA